MPPRDLGELTNWDINAYYDDELTYGGCLSKDGLKFLPDNKFYVINMQDSTGPGSHWVLVYDCRPDTCIYFDSYGISPPESIRAFMRKSKTKAGKKKKLVYTDSQYQELSTATCGVFCIHVANELRAGKTLAYVIKHSLAPSGGSDRDPLSDARLRANEFRMQKLIPAIV